MGQRLMGQRLMGQRFIEQCFIRQHYTGWCFTKDSLIHIALSITYGHNTH